MTSTVARNVTAPTTISGTLLPGISRIELWQMAQEVPEFAIELLAEEEAQRKEAQELLDELGLPLYETPQPAIDPVTGQPVPGGALPGTLPDPGDPAAVDTPAEPAVDLPPSPPSAEEPVAEDLEETD